MRQTMQNTQEAGPAVARKPRAHVVFRIPLMLAALTLVGLVAALLGDDWLDVVSWVGLGIPVLACLWKSA
jgi:hypothetical protein